MVSWRTDKCIRYGLKRTHVASSVQYCFSDNRHNLGNSVLCAHHIHLVKNRDAECVVYWLVNPLYLLSAFL